MALPPPTQPPAGILAAPADTGTWGPVLDWGQQAKHMAMLSTGKVLVWSTGDNARVWNPTTGAFTLTPFTFGDLHCAGQSTLADGRLVVVGGQDGAVHNGTNITALFDPATETWTNGQADDRPALVRDQHRRSPTGSCWRPPAMRRMGPVRRSRSCTTRPPTRGRG